MKNIFTICLFFIIVTNVFSQPAKGSGILYFDSNLDMISTIPTAKQSQIGVIQGENQMYFFNLVTSAWEKLDSVLVYDVTTIYGGLTTDGDSIGFSPWALQNNVFQTIAGTNRVLVTGTDSITSKVYAYNFRSTGDVINVNNDIPADTVTYNADEKYNYIETSGSGGDGVIQIILDTVTAIIFQTNRTVYIVNNYLANKAKVNILYKDSLLASMNTEERLSICVLSSVADNWNVQKVTNIISDSTIFVTLSHLQDSTAAIRADFPVGGNVYNTDGTLGGSRILNGNSFELLFDSLLKMSIVADTLIVKGKPGAGKSSPVLSLYNDPDSATPRKFSMSASGGMTSDVDIVFPSTAPPAETSKMLFSTTGVGVWGYDNYSLAGAGSMVTVGGVNPDILSGTNSVQYTGGQLKVYMKGTLGADTHRPLGILTVPSSAGGVGWGTGIDFTIKNTSSVSRNSGSIDFEMTVGTNNNESANITFNNIWDGVIYENASISPTGLFTTKSIALGKTVTAGGTTGAQTINKACGSVNFAASAASVVVTNSLVTTGSIIICTVGTNDSTMQSVKAVAAAGSFTLFADAVPTSETRVNFLVIN